MEDGLADKTERITQPGNKELSGSRQASSGLLGDDIRALRKQKNLTLIDLANALGRSIGWLSQVERNQAEPTIQDLQRIARKFDIPISFFFRNSQAPVEELGTIVRSENRTAIGSRAGGVVEELLSPDIAGDFEMLRSVFEPGARGDDKPARPAQEGGYLVSGELEMWIGDRHYKLREGDSFQFQNKPCSWHNSSNKQTVVIWIISPPIY